MTAPVLAPPPGPLLLARELGRCGVPMIVVGSAAVLLWTGRGRPRDLDVVLHRAAVPDLLTALHELGVPAVPRELSGPSPRTVLTGWCPLDVFLDAGQRPASMIVGGVEVAVPS